MKDVFLLISQTLLNLLLKLILAMLFMILKKDLLLVLVWLFNYCKQLVMPA